MIFIVIRIETKKETINKKIEGGVFLIEEEKYDNKWIMKQINILLNFRTCSILIVTYHVAAHVVGMFLTKFRLLYIKEMHLIKRRQNM